MTDAYSGTRRYLALLFPFLSAERLQMQESDCQDSASDTPPDGPLVLVARVGNVMRLAATDARAQGLGLTPGQTLADARARHPDLAAVAMDTAADNRFLGQLAQQCGGYSPSIQMTRPDGITIDISGAAHLFGGEAGLIESAVDRLAATGLTIRYATAETAEGARALARHVGFPANDERMAIRALPVTALGLADEATLGLQRAGLKTVGDMAVRPFVSIAARFGEDAIKALRCLLGELHVPTIPLPHDAPLRFERRFAEPVGDQSAIAAALLALMQEATAALAERGLGGRGFRLRLFRSDGAKRHLDIETGAPTRDPALVLRLFDERIATLADPLDPGFGYDSIVLSIRVTEPLDALQPEFDSNAQATDVLADLIDRLSTRLGPGAVRRLVPHDSHIPEQSQLALPAIECPVPARWPCPPPGEPPMRPLFLFDPPQRIDVIAQVPDGPPHRFRWRGKLHEVRLYEGPERIAVEWWRRKGGEVAGKGGLTRDYYRLEDVRGRRFWIFRHGLYEEKPDPRWYMHGLFA